MKKIHDVEPKNKNSFEYFEWLKRENARALRQAGHKAPALNNEPRKRKLFAKRDDSKIRSVSSKMSYWKWQEKYGARDEEENIIEPREANPDSFGVPDAES